MENLLLWGIVFSICTSMFSFAHEYSHIAKVAQSVDATLFQRAVRVADPDRGEEGPYFLKSDCRIALDNYLLMNLNPKYEDFYEVAFHFYPEDYPTEFRYELSVTFISICTYHDERTFRIVEGALHEH